MFVLSHRSRIFAVLLNLALLPACERKTAAPNDAGVDASPVQSVVVATPPPMVQDPLPDAEDASIPAAEAVRKWVPRIEDEPSLAKQRDAITGFFKPTVPSPLAVQIETLPAGRTAILVRGEQEIDSPFVMVIDPNGTRAWTKDRPLAGIVSGVRDVVIVRGPESSVGIAFCDATGHRAALRTWHNDGSINADFEVMEVPHCDTIAALYIPNVGHLVASSGEATARFGMIASNGMRVWDAAGIDLPWSALPRTTLALAVDTEDSFVVVGAGMLEGKTAPRDGSILAMRYDLRGRPIWKVPMNVGPRSTRSTGPIHVRVLSWTKMEVDWDDKPVQRAALSSDGVVVPLK